MSAIVGALAVGVIGAVSAGGSAFQLIRARRLRGNGIAAVGTVVAQDSQFNAAGSSGAYGKAGGTAFAVGASTDGDLVQNPVIAFTTRDGRQFRVTSPASGNESSFVPGSRVTVYYDPGDPTRFTVPEQQVGIYRLFLAIGVFLLLGLLAYAVFGHALLAKLPFGIPILLGGVFGGIGWFGIHRTWRIKHGGRTDGIVVGTTESETRNGITLHHPMVRYAVPGAGAVDAPSIRGHMGAPPPVGVRVRVCYDRTNPSRMLLAYDGTRPVFWIFGVIGAVVLVVGIVIAIAVAI